MLVPIVLLFVAPVPPVESAALLTYIADHRAVYLTELICFVGLAVPALGVFVAVATALWNTAPPVAALGGLLGVVSETIALALASAQRDRALPVTLAALGEISLAGEIRHASAAKQRTAEAKRLGFSTVLDSEAVHLREAVRLAFAGSSDDRVDAPDF